jgi:N-acetylglucosamine malate deacetylase 1
MADILCVVAHPDDESLFAGGTLARLTSDGYAVHVVALSDGVSSRVRPTTDAATRRQQHFEQACHELGVTGEIRVTFPDQRSDTLPQLLINREVAAIIQRHQPKNMVFTHHAGDLNIDHRRVAEAVFVETRGLDLQVFSMAPEFPGRCVGPAWNWSDEWPIDARVKARACACYVDERRPYPHPRSERAIREQTVERFLEIR